MGVIEIDKTLVPYSFNVELSGLVYTFTINYNFLFDYFTVDLALGDTILVSGEKLVLNEILFRDLVEDKDGNLNSNFPSEILFPAASDDSIERITYDNFGSEVQLYYADRSEV